METALISFRWQNIFAIWLIVLGLALAGVIGTQVYKRVAG